MVKSSKAHMTGTVHPLSLRNSPHDPSPAIFFTPQLPPTSELVSKQGSLPLSDTFLHRHSDNKFEEKGQSIAGFRILTINNATVCNTSGEGRIPTAKSSSSGITHGVLAKHFHLPLNTVARKFGLCPTALKKLCRKYGIARWPHRKLKSLDKKIASLRAETKYTRGDSEGGGGKQEWDLRRLEQAKADLFSGDVSGTTWGLDNNDDDDDDDDDNENNNDDDDDEATASPSTASVQRSSIKFLTQSEEPEHQQLLPNSTGRPAAASSGSFSVGTNLVRVVNRGFQSRDDHPTVLGSKHGDRVKEEGVADGQCVQLVVLSKDAPAVVRMCSAVGVQVLKASLCPLPSPGSKDHGPWCKTALPEESAGVTVSDCVRAHLHLHPLQHTRLPSSKNNDAVDGHRFSSSQRLQSSGHVGPTPAGTGNWPILPVNGGSSTTNSNRGLWSFHRTELLPGMNSHCSPYPACHWADGLPCELTRGQMTRGPGSAGGQQSTWGLGGHPAPPKDEGIPRRAVSSAIEGNIPSSGAEPEREWFGSTRPQSLSHSSVLSLCMSASPPSLLPPPPSLSSSLQEDLLR